MNMDSSAFFKLSYGIYVLTSSADGRDGGCIINTAVQITDSPKTIAITVNKSNYTNYLISVSGVLNLSVLTEDTSFEHIKRFGFSSGRDTDKFKDLEGTIRTDNGVLAVTAFANAYFSAKMINVIDVGTHTVFICEVTEAKVLSDAPSATYDYYFKHIKPKPDVKKALEGKKKTYVCKICGYVYEGEELPADFICPLCKHGAEDFEEV